MSLISLKNIKYLYNSKESSGISNLSLTIKPGQIVSLLGPSGSGKTTIQKIILNELFPQSGHIIHNEIKVFSKENLEEQNFNDLKPLEYLTTKTKDLEKARELLFKFEITNTVYRKAYELSNGEKQRLILANLFMHDFDLLVCDEIFSGIDYNNRQIILKIIKELLIETKRSLIWSTQLIKDALKYSDNVCLLQFGQVEQIGTPEEMIFKPASLFAAQFFGPVNLFVLRPSNTGIQLDLQKIKKIELANEGLIVIRPEYVTLGTTYDCNLDSSVFDGNSYLNSARYESEMIYFYSSTKLNQPKVSLDIALSHAHVLTEI